MLKINHVIVVLVFSAILIYLGIGMLLYFKQRSFIYFPVRDASSGYEQMVVQNQEASISVTHINSNSTKAILYFGGNAENVDFSVPGFSGLFPEYAVYFVKYRGYGASTGRPTEAGIYSDALLVYDTLLKNHDSISVIGRSLGSGVATYLAANRKVNKLVLVTPFDSISSLAQKRYPLYPVSWLLKDKFDSLSRAKSINAQTLVVAAENDRIVPRQHTDIFVDALDPALTTYQIIPGRGHNDLSDSNAYHVSLRSFL